MKFFKGLTYKEAFKFIIDFLKWRRNPGRIYFYFLGAGLTVIFGGGSIINLLLSALLPENWTVLR